MKPIRLWPLWCRFFGHGDHLSAPTEEWLAGRWLFRRRCSRCGAHKLTQQRVVVRGAATHRKE